MQCVSTIRRKILRLYDMIYNGLPPKDFNSLPSFDQSQPQPRFPLHHQTPKKSHWLKKTFKALFYSAVICVGFFVFFYVKANILQSKNGQNSWVNYIPIIGQIKNLAESAERPLKGEDRDRINILLLGIGGVGNDAPNLTDTMMVVSLQPSTKKVAMVSIPRDLLVPVEGHGWQKINSIDSYAEQANPGSGGLATAQAVSNIIAQPIDYYVRVDFNGFENFVDQLGPLNICVDRAFDDYTYPVAGQENNPVYVNRFVHLHFDAGCQTMDGKTALEFSRSRHSLSAEGTDFARAARQQKVMSAIKDKIFSVNTLMSPQLIASLIGSISSHVNTNLQIWEIVKIANNYKDTKNEDIIHKVLDNSPAGLLVDGVSQDGAYILTPKNGDFTQVQYLFAQIFAADTAAAAAVADTGANANVEILNGTWVNGLASRYSTDLGQAGFKIVNVANAGAQDYQKTVIYDLSNGQKNKALQNLQQKMNANVSTTEPDWLKAYLAQPVAGLSSSSLPDLVVVLGQDADKSGSGTTNTQ